MVKPAAWAAHSPILMPGFGFQSCCCYSFLLRREAVGDGARVWVLATGESTVLVFVLVLPGAGIRRVNQQVDSALHLSNKVQ